MSIVAAAKKDFKCVPDDILEIIKERTLDKRFKIRKEALQGLGKEDLRISHIYSVRVAAGVRFPAWEPAFFHTHLLINIKKLWNGFIIIICKL